MNIITNIKKSYKHIPYSFKHYIMVMKLEKKYIGYYKYPFHDLDKIFMYIFFPFLGTKVIQKIHTRFAKHHLRKYKKRHFEKRAIHLIAVTKPANSLLSYRSFLIGDWAPIRISSVILYVFFITSDAE